MVGLQIKIEGIYFWGEGISSEDSKNFKEFVAKFCADNKIELGEPFFGVQQTEKEIYAYFHAMQTVLVGEEKRILGLASKFKNGLLLLNNIKFVSICDLTNLEDYIK